MIDLFIEIQSIRIGNNDVSANISINYIDSSKKEDVRCLSIRRRSYRNNKHNEVMIMTRNTNGIHVLRKPEKLKNTRIPCND